MFFVIAAALFILASGAALAFFLLHARPKRGKSSFCARRLGTELPEYLRTAALKERPNAGKTLFLLLPARSLKRMLRFFLHLPPEGATVIHRLIRENGRFILEQLHVTLQEKKPVSNLIEKTGGGLFAFAREYLAHQNGQLRFSRLEEALFCWRENAPITEAELLRLPFFLRAALLFILEEIISCCTREEKARQKAQKLLSLLENGKEKQAHRYFAGLRRRNSFPLLIAALREKEGLSLPAWLVGYYIGQESEAADHRMEWQERQSSHCLWMRNAIDSLKKLDTAPWDRLLENMSPLHTLLEKDPVYPAMDAESRLYYRRSVCAIAGKLHKPELQVMSTAFSLCEKAPADPLLGHAGYYLIREGRRELEAQLSGKTFSAGMDFLKKPLPFLLCSLAGVLLLMGAGFLAGLPFWILPLFAAVLTFALYHAGQALLRRLLPVPCTPRLELPALTEEMRTLVLCPARLFSKEQAQAAVKRLRTLHTANPDKNLHFLLLGQFRSSLTGLLGEDEEIMTEVSGELKRLKKETGHDFLYFQLQRSVDTAKPVPVSAQEKPLSVRPILNLLTAGETGESFAYSSIPPEKLKNRYRYVITLGEQTFLPPGTALRLVGCLQHPLNRLHSRNGRLQGAGMVFPALELDLGKTESKLGALYGCRKEAYPDAAETAFLTGACAFDPAFYASAAAKPWPEGAQPPLGIAAEDENLLHAEDIPVLTAAPSTLTSFFHQRQKQTKTLWTNFIKMRQLLFSKNAKVRSLLKNTAKKRLFMQMLMLFFPMGLVALLLLLALLGRSWLILFTLVLLLPFFWGQGRTAHVSALMHIASLPLLAAADAESILRCIFSKSSSYALDASLPGVDAQNTVRHSMKLLFIGLGFSGAMGACCFFSGSLSVPGLLLAGLWAVLPAIAPMLEEDPGQLYPTAYMREELLSLAKETLLYFETVITDADHGLPPISVQLEPAKGIRHHTTPGSMGLYLLSLLAAERLGLMDAETLLQNAENAVESMEKLDKWKGLFYSGYNTLDLAPAPPYFVSTTENGLLAACLLCCATGLKKLFPEENGSFAKTAQRLSKLFYAMDLHALFDEDTELFFEGFYPRENAVKKRRLRYLAGTNRLIGFIAIAFSRIPASHWRRLKRIPIRSKGGETLLSAEGSMSEYLLPMLFHRPKWGSLLFCAMKGAVRAQRRHKKSGAFGISEGAYYSFDPELFYKSKCFGLPALSGRSGVEDTVLSPYASILSLPLGVKPAFLNLLRMRAMGLEGSLGLFEAADLDPRRIGKGSKMKVIRSHNTVHQGMILVTLCNVLCRWYIADLFVSHPETAAHSALLEEKAMQLPRPFRHTLVPRRRFPEEKPGIPSRRVLPFSFPIEGHLISGNGTTLFTDAQGSGALLWEGRAVTAFSPVCTLPQGIRFYMKDSQSGASWQPTDPRLIQAVDFEAAQAVYQSERFHIQTALRMFVSPLDGAVIHHFTLENTTKNDRMLELASYFEPAWSKDAAQLQSRKLGKSGICLRKRSAEAGSQRLLKHFLTGDVPFHLIRIQTDRAAFLGRGKTPFSPRAMELPISSLADSLGDMSDPCISLRCQMVVPGEAKVHVAFVTCLTDQPEADEALLRRYDRPENALRAYDLALMKEQASMEALGMTPEEYAEALRLTGCLLYTGQPMQFSCSGQNTLPSSALKTLGLCPETPVLLVDTDDMSSGDTILHLLRAHRLLRMNGLIFQLVFLLDCGKSGDGEQLLLECLKEGCPESLLHAEGGVFVFRRDEIAPESCALLKASARLGLSASAGETGRQLDKMIYRQNLPPEYLPKPSAAFKTALPPGEPLQAESDLGGFTVSGGDYVITLPPGRNTPAPWLHPLPGSQMHTLAAESGILLSLPGNSPALPPSLMTDRVSPENAEGFFLRDQENKLLWSVTRSPLAQALPCRIRFSPGEAVYETSGYGIYSKLSVFTDEETGLGIRTLILKNEDQRERTITFCHQYQLPLGDYPVWQQLCRPEKTERGVFFACPDLDCTLCLAGVEPLPAHRAILSPGQWQGLYGSVPYGLSAVEMPEGDMGSVAILLFTMQLAPGESKTITTAAGCGLSRPRLERTLNALGRKGAVKHRHKTLQRLEHRLNALQIFVPDPEMSLLLSRWLPYQNYVFQPEFFGGCLKTSERLQLLLPLIHIAPKTARQGLLDCAAQQQPDGSLQNETGYDEQLLLPYVAAQYVGITTDASLLQAQVPYAKDSSAAPETFFLHLIRAVDSIPTGEHGIPLFFSGSGKGENILLGMFLAQTLHLLAPLCDAATANRFATMRIKLLQALDHAGWDGEWYIKGWYSTGENIGSSHSAEGCITLAPQCASVFAGLSRQRCATAMESVRKYLFQQESGLLRTFTPPYDGLEKPGGILRLVPGRMENGGQSAVECAWSMAAWLQLGNTEQAWETAAKLLPTAGSYTRQSLHRYRGEPYLMADYISTAARSKGRAEPGAKGLGAAWYQHLLLTELLGLRTNGNRLWFRPVLPKSWDQATVTLRYHSAVYRLNARRDCPFPMADGMQLTEGCLPLQDDGRLHEAFFPIRG